MSAPVRIALVGLGWWGQKITAVLKAAPDDVTIVRAVEPNGEIASAFSTAHDVPVSADLETALADPAVEAVLLVTPFIPGDLIKAGLAAALTASLLKARPASVLSRG